MTDTAQCGRCGAPVRVGALFCGRCGVDVTAPQDDDETLELTTGGTPMTPGPARSTMRQMLREATLGEYEILDELGRGGMATVFRAHDISLDRKVAIKVMAPHLLEGEGMAERFKLEARTAAQLSHPHIIPIYAVKESASTLFFVMKYVEGRALDEIIGRTGQLPIPMVKDILIKVGSALGYAHRRGVVHRDVKPGNIMIDEEGTPIMTDFGIAKVTESTGLTITGTTIGTPSYMSPEQCEAKEVTGQSDQYSLGVVAFQMLTGRLPFEGDSAVTVMYKHCHEELPPLEDFRPDCPPEILETVKRMVAKAPRERWPSMEAAIQKLGIASTSDTYLDPVRKELVKAAKEGDLERLAELSTPGHSMTPVEGAAPLEADTATGGARRWAAVAATVLLVGAGAAAAIMQPWAEGGDALSGNGEAPEIGAVGPGEAGPGETDGTAGGDDPPDAGPGETDGGGPALAAGGNEEPDTGAGDPVQSDAQGREAAVGGVVPAGGAPAEGEGQAAALVVGRVQVSGVPERLDAGDRVDLRASAFDESGDPIPPATVEECAIHGWSECGYRWTSSDTRIASVAVDGEVTALAPGTAEISVSVDGVVGRALVDVTEASVATVTVSPAALEMILGERSTVSVEVLDGSGRPLGDRPASWSSANEEVARVDQAGTVEAIGSGRTTITADVGGASASVSVSVELDARTAVETLVNQLARAMESRDVEAMRVVYPTMSQDMASGYRDFFPIAENLRVTLTADPITEGQQTAAARITGTLVYNNAAGGGRETSTPVEGEGSFALGPDGWRIVQLTFEN